MVFFVGSCINISRTRQKFPGNVQCLSTPDVYPPQRKVRNFVVCSRLFPRFICWLGLRCEDANRRHATLPFFSALNYAAIHIITLLCITRQYVTWGYGMVGNHTKIYIFRDAEYVHPVNTNSGMLHAGLWKGVFDVGIHVNADQRVRLLHESRPRLVRQWPSAMVRGHRV